jgi:hypothetical protein
MSGAPVIGRAVVRRGSVYVGRRGYIRRARRHWMGTGRLGLGLPNLNRHSRRLLWMLVLALAWLGMGLCLLID